MTELAETREKTIDRRALRRMVVKSCFKTLRYFEEMHGAATREAGNAFEIAQELYPDESAEEAWEEAWHDFWLRNGFAGKEQPDLAASYCRCQRAVATAADDLVDQIMDGRSACCLREFE